MNRRELFKASGAMAANAILVPFKRKQVVTVTDVWLDANNVRAEQIGKPIAYDPVMYVWRIEVIRA